MTCLLSFRVVSEPFGPWRPRGVWILGPRVVCGRSDSELPRSLWVTTQVAFGSRTRTETCRDLRSVEFRQHCRQSSSNFIQFLQKHCCWCPGRWNLLHWVFTTPGPKTFGKKVYIDVQLVHAWHQTYRRLITVFMFTVCFWRICMFWRDSGLAASSKSQNWKLRVVWFQSEHLHLFLGQPELCLVHIF